MHTHLSVTFVSEAILAALARVRALFIVVSMVAILVPWTAHVAAQPGRGVEVPGIVGQTVAGARQLLRTAKLDLVVDRKNGGYDESYIIVSQTPPKGKLVPFGTDVVVQVRVPDAPRPIARVPVPGLLGRTLDDVRKLTADGKLTLHVESPLRFEDSWRVEKQQPAAGEWVKPGTSVLVWLAPPPPPPAQVPGLVSHTLAEAQKLAGDAKLRLNVESRPPFEDSWRVEKQQPAAGERVKPGTSVLVWLAPPSPEATGSLPEKEPPPSGVLPGNVSSAVEPTRNNPQSEQPGTKQQDRTGQTLPDPAGKAYTANSHPPPPSETTASPRAGETERSWINWATVGFVIVGIGALSAARPVARAIRRRVEQNGDRRHRPPTPDIHSRITLDSSRQQLEASESVVGPAIRFRLTTGSRTTNLIEGGS